MPETPKQSPGADIVILGAGPAALTLAIALQRLGLQAQVIGRPRLRPAIEGLSHRAAQGLRQLGCHAALALLGAPWQRLSSWAGAQVEMNGEFVIERQALDAALAMDVRQAGIALHDGLVHRIEHGGPGDWRIHWEDTSGALRATPACFVVESRGRTAAKWAVDRYAGAPALALTRALRTQRRGRRTTFTESFAQGWAWGAVDADGSATVQLVMRPEGLKEQGGKPENAHAAGLEQLGAARELLGELQPAGDTSVRGIQTVWRGACCLLDGLRLGDAAYTSDPLSGHGMFEALSGALAAAPVIRTLLQRPGQAPLAREFYEDRIRQIFLERLRTAAGHYAAETRWADEPFWRRMHALGQLPQQAPAVVPEVAALVRQPVVEDGFIVERCVVRTPQQPRGVRFIDGIDLPNLHERLQSVPRELSLEQLCAQIGGRPDAMRNALRWMQAQRLI
jgi:flavin-dependent dehydrogenase